LVHLHGILYWEDYRFDAEFESYVAEYMAKFVRERTERERIWIVESHGEVLGCIAVVKNTDEEAWLRWFLVHPKARGKGIGKRLLDEALAFARSVGYSSIYLLTVSILEDAARLYLKAGFRVTYEKEEVSWGRKLLHQRYDLAL
jgi:GNAT superfamily N-acetyltransferase